MKTILNDVIWTMGEEKLRLAHKKRVKKSPKPTMWQFNPNGGIPKELTAMDPSTFLTSPLGQILCFLPREVLIRLCSMLPARTFLNLSSTCRFLHWRMYTYCTCYVPYTVNMSVQDYLATADLKSLDMDIPSKLTYSLNKNILNEVLMDDDDEETKAFCKRYVSIRAGQRGIHVYQPFCLRKPFFFDAVDLYIFMPFYYKRFYDRCLPYIMAVRGLTRHLDVRIVHETNIPNLCFINFSDTNDFLTTVNASFCDNIFAQGCDNNGSRFRRNNTDIYLNCPYTQQMYRAHIVDINRLDVPAFQHSIGIYSAVDSTVKATLKNALTGSTNLIFHQYIGIELIDGRFPLMEFLFEEFGEFEKLMSAIKGKRKSTGHPVWKKVVTTENGGQLRIILDKEKEVINLRIGKDETFEEMDTKYTHNPLYSEKKVWWKPNVVVGKKKNRKGIDEKQAASRVCQCSII